MVHFRGTEAETRICPRRHAIRNPFVFTVQEVYNGTDGKLGAQFLNITNKLADGLQVVGEALVWRKEAGDGV